MSPISDDYNLAGQKTEFQYPDGHSLFYNYNSVGQLTDLTSNWVDGRHPAGLLTSISYSSAGAVDYALYGNNRELRRGYRPSTGQLQHHEIRNVDRPFTNSGFEEGSGTDASGWDEVLSASRSTERALTGKASMKIAAGWIGNATTSGYIPVQGSSTYTLSGYIYILYRHSGNIYLDLNDGNAQGQNITDVNLQANTSKVGVWQRVAGTFTTAPATTGVKVRIVYDGAQTDMSVVFYADEISITPGTSPPAAAWTYDYRDPNTPAGSTMIGIANAGFESGSGTNAYDWNQFGTSRSTTRAHSGSASLKVDHAVGSVLNAATASYIAVEGSTSYWLSAWVYVQSSSGGNLYLDLDDGHGQGEDFNDVTIAANSSLVGSWQHITGMFQTAAGTTGVKVRVVHASAASIVAYVDDLTLEKEMGDLEAPQNGMIQEIRDQVNPSYSETYSYDNLYRLTHAESSVWTASWSYDRSGNRLSQTTTGVSYSETLSISSISNRVNSWTYDAVGNVTNDGVHTYQYDAENRLIKIDGGSTAQYAYGPQGERISKIAAGVTTYFYWGIGEKVGGQWTRLYVSGLGGKLVEYSGGTTWFLATNHLGTIAARMNVSGTLMETYRYLPYGERYSGGYTPHQYTGKERDAESGLDYFGARYYASSHGRWMSVDPVVQPIDPQNLNRYSYTKGDPINLVDPTGGEISFTPYQMQLLLEYILSALPHFVGVSAPISQPILIPTPPPAPSWSGGSLSATVGATAQSGGQSAYFGLGAQPDPNYKYPNRISQDCQNQFRSFFSSFRGTGSDTGISGKMWKVLGAGLSLMPDVTLSWNAQYYLRHQGVYSGMGSVAGIKTIYIDPGDLKSYLNSFGVPEEDHYAYGFFHEILEIGYWEAFPDERSRAIRNNDENLEKAIHDSIMEMSDYFYSSIQLLNQEFCKP